MTPFQITIGIFLSGLVGVRVVEHGYVKYCKELE